MGCPQAGHVSGESVRTFRQLPHAFPISSRCVLPHAPHSGARAVIHPHSPHTRLSSPVRRKTVVSPTDALGDVAWCAWTIASTCFSFDMKLRASARTHDLEGFRRLLCHRASSTEGDSRRWTPHLPLFPPYPNEAQICENQRRIRSRQRLQVRFDVFRIWQYCHPRTRELRFHIRRRYLASLRLQPGDGNG